MSKVLSASNYFFPCHCVSPPTSSLNLFHICTLFSFNFLGLLIWSTPILLLAVSLGHGMKDRLCCNILYATPPLTMIHWQISSHLKYDHTQVKKPEILYLKLIQCYRSMIAQQIWGKKKKTLETQVLLLNFISFALSVHQIILLYFSSFHYMFIELPIQLQFKLLIIFLRDSPGGGNLGQIWN